MGREAKAEWNGDLQGGSGRFEFGDGAFTGNYTFKSRFEDGEGTNPEQLIAAAHASCFSMALSGILADHGHAPESVETTADVKIKMVDGEPRITNIALKTVGKVPGIDAEHFAHHAEEAKEGCPVSKALAGVDEITLETEFEG
jgi:lipoyl-dependent peroxiredoxin